MTGWTEMSLSVLLQSRRKVQRKNKIPPHTHGHLYLSYLSTQRFPPVSLAIANLPLRKRTMTRGENSTSLHSGTLMCRWIQRCRALGWTKKLCSPVFFSTGEDGVVRQGLEGVPRRRPILFVGNHQTYALDIGPLVESLIRERQIFPRGLAHPAIWAVILSPSLDNDARSFGLQAESGWRTMHGHLPSVY